MELFEEFKEKVENLIFENQLDQALNEIIGYIESKPFPNLEISCKLKLRELADLEAENMAGQITREEYTVKKNNIAKDLFAMVKTVKSGKDITLPTQGIITKADEQQLNTILVAHYKNFNRIIYGVLIASAGLFFYFISMQEFGAGSAFFTSSGGSYYILTKNTEKMLKAIGSRL